MTPPRPARPPLAPRTATSYRSTTTARPPDRTSSPWHAPVPIARSWPNLPRSWRSSGRRGARKRSRGWPSTATAWLPFRAIWCSETPSRHVTGRRPKRSWRSPGSRSCVAARGRRSCGTICPSAAAAKRPADRPARDRDRGTRRATVPHGGRAAPSSWSISTRCAAPGPGPSSGSPSAISRRQRAHAPPSMTASFRSRFRSHWMQSERRARLSALRRVGRRHHEAARLENAGDVRPPPCRPGARAANFKQHRARPGSSVGRAADF